MVRALRRWLFIQLWANNAGTCKTCGADEGRCREETCARLRLTHKLGLEKAWR